MTAPFPPPESLWHQTAPPIPVDHDLPPSADVLVVGAGITGLAVAAMLARAGAAPVVIDAHRVGALTTGGTTGKLSLLQGSTLSQVRSHAGDDALRAYVAAGHAGVDWLRSELRDHPEALETRTAVTYATTTRGAQALDAEAEACRIAGLDVTDLGAEASGTPLPTIGLPFAVHRALTLDDQHQLHPLHMLAALAETVRAAGGIVVEDCRMLQADADDAGVRVRTGRGQITADRVVLATGTPVLDRGLYFSTLEPTREFVAAYRVEGDLPRGMYLSVDPVSRSLRTARDAAGAEVLLVGGDSFTAGRDHDTAARLDRLDGWARDHFARAARVTWWGAQDYSPVSRLPVAGPVTGGRGRIFAASGYSKWGMSNAVAAALTIAGELAGSLPDWARELRERSPGLRDAGAFARTNAEVGGWYLRGWSGALARVASTASAPDAYGGAAPDEEDADATTRPRVRRSGMRPVAESTVDGVTCRVSGICSHLGGIVEWNSAERTWDCPLHGSRFTPDGEVIEGPATRPLKPVPPASVPPASARPASARPEEDQ